MIVMVLADELVVVFNATAERDDRRPSTHARGACIRCWPSATSFYADGAFTVPARTVAVFLP